MCLTTLALCNADDQTRIRLRATNMLEADIDTIGHRGVALFIFVYNWDDRIRGRAKIRIRILKRQLGYWRGL